MHHLHASCNPYRKPQGQTPLSCFNTTCDYLVRLTYATSSSCSYHWWYHLQVTGVLNLKETNVPQGNTHLFRQTWTVWRSIWLSFYSIAYGKFMPPKLKYDHTVRFCARLVFFSLVCLSLVCLTAAPAQVKESFWFRLLWDVCVCFIQTIRMRTSIDTTYFRW